MMALTAARGCAFGFYMPPAQGLLPQTVPAGQIASANAVRRLGLNGAQIGGAAVGGIVVAAADPGWGLVADAASYGVAALLRAGMRFGTLPPIERAGMIGELRDGWRAFTSRLAMGDRRPVRLRQRGLRRRVHGSRPGARPPEPRRCRELGPDPRRRVDRRGPRRGADDPPATEAPALRREPCRTHARPPPARARRGTAVVVVAFTALLAGVGGEVFEINWSTALQEQIPSQMLSRVAAYDALGSVALAPIGTTLAGPVALALGIGTTLTGAAIVILASSLVVLCVSEVRTLTRHIPAAPGPDALAG
jgi:hypothetical protein